MELVDELRLVEGPLHADVQSLVKDGFAEHAISKIQSDGAIETAAFTAYYGQEFAGALECQIFFGALHIKKLFVVAAFRNRKLASKLMEQAFAFGSNRSCTFAFVETFDFQALEFYRRIGFAVEFSRSGYTHGAVFHYLKKNF
eukprot:GILK01010677.1.p1 GENE.GILK01010677.1~~GILK01010677.1.p1  ORF type:complete len:154 (-),score=27.86 GILK01010677.1:339-767(-)